jgi:hypothetical protein
MVAAALALVGATARAEPTLRLDLEAGSEVDSNVHRAPSDSGDVHAGVDARVGARFGVAGRAGEHAAYALDAVGAAKGFAGPEASGEDLGLVGLDGRVDLAAGAIVPGLRLSYTDIFGAESSALPLRTADATASAALLVGPDLRVAALAGWRGFTYKPDGAFSFDGPHAGVSVGERLAADDRDWQLRWAAAYSASWRRYSSPALADYCPRGAPKSPSCLGVTSSARADLFHDLAVDVTYTGGFIASARLALQLDQSSSFGQSLARARLELSGTVDLIWDVVLTTQVVLQVDDYLDGLLLGGDLGTFTTVEDEARNGWVVHLSRELSDTWTVEARFAVYANALAARAVAYDREVAYLGAIVRFR